MQLKWGKFDVLRNAVSFHLIKRVESLNAEEDELYRKTLDQEF